LQHAGDNSLRGRAYLPGGRQIDLFDPNEGQDFAHNPTGSQWGYTDMGFPSAGGQTSGGIPLSGNTGLNSAIGGLDALLQGSPYARIQQAIQQVNRPNFQALMAQLQGT
jgi:hypothetical protein